MSWDEALDEIATRLNEIRASGDGPQAILPYSYAGTMGMVQGSSMDRRFFHRIGASKLDRTICSMAGTIGMRMTVGANVGADPGRHSRERSDSALGHEHAHGESASLAVRARGARARRADHRDRPDPNAHRRAVRRVDRDPPGHRRRARAGHDARAVRARAARTLSTSPRTRSASSSCASARASIRRSASAAITGVPGRDDRLARRTVRALEGRVHSRQLRPAAPRRRRHGRAHDRVPARVDGPLAACRRRRAALVERELRSSTSARWSARTCRRRCARST